MCLFSESVASVRSKKFIADDPVVKRQFGWRDSRLVVHDNKFGRESSDCYSFCFCCSVCAAPASLFSSLRMGKWFEVRNCWCSSSWCTHSVCLSEEEKRKKEVCESKGWTTKCGSAAATALRLIVSLPHLPFTYLLLCGCLVVLDVRMERQEVVGEGTHRIRVWLKRLEGLAGGFSDPHNRFFTGSFTTSSSFIGGRTCVKHAVVWRRQWEDSEYVCLLRGHSWGVAAGTDICTYRVWWRWVESVLTHWLPRVGPQITEDLKRTE